MMQDVDMRIGNTVFCLLSIEFLDWFALLFQSAAKLLYSSCCAAGLAYIEEDASSTAP
jgi:hypothetical protein